MTLHSTQTASQRSTHRRPEDAPVLRPGFVPADFSSLPFVELVQGRRTEDRKRRFWLPKRWRNPNDSAVQGELYAYAYLAHLRASIQLNMPSLPLAWIVAEMPPPEGDGSSCIPGRPDERSRCAGPSRTAYPLEVSLRRGSLEA